MKLLRDIGGGTANLGGWVADQVRRMAGGAPRDDATSGDWTGTDEHADDEKGPKS
jgi:hypothetical protein